MRMKRTMNLGWMTGFAMAGALACGSEPALPSEVCVDAKVLVLASDRVSTGLGAAGCNGAQRSVPLKVGADLGGDAQLATSNGAQWVVARDLETVFSLEAGQAVSKRGLSGKPGKGSRNPQGMAQSKNGLLWIPFFNSGELSVYDAPSASMLVPKQTLTLSDLDPDGNPDVSLVFSVETPDGERIGVALSRLTEQNDRSSIIRQQSVQPSSIALFDPVTLKRDRVLSTAGRNPFGVPKKWGNKVVLSMVGRVDVDTEVDAGVELFDGQTSKLLITEAALGGSVVETEIQGDCGFAIVMDASANNRTSVVSFRASTGQALRVGSQAVFGPAEDFNQGPSGLAIAAGELWVGSRKREADGLFRVLHYTLNEQTCELGPRAEVTVALPPIGLLPAR
jgi:hypothetical protein